MTTCHTKPKMKTCFWGMIKFFTPQLIEAVSDKNGAVSETAPFFNPVLSTLVASTAVNNCWFYLSARASASEAIAIG